MRFKRVIKKTLCTVMVLSMVFCASTPYVHADSQSNNDGETLEYYLFIQSEENTTLLDEDVEKQLNEAGLFDSEINDLPENVISDLNDGAEYSINTMYTSLVENEDGTFEVRELTPAEIDSYIISEYGEEIKNYKNNHKNWWKSFISLFSAKASTSTSYSGEVVVDSKFKHSVMIEKNSSKSYYTVTYIANWTQNPLNNYTDLIGFTVTNGTYSSGRNAYAAATRSNGLTTYSCTSGMKSTTNKLGTKVNLNTITNDGRNPFRSCNIVLSANYTKTSSSKPMTVYTEYQHQVLSLSTAPSVSFASGGTNTFSLGVKLRTAMQELTPNCITTMQ